MICRQITDVVGRNNGKKLRQVVWFNRVIDSSFVIYSDENVYSTNSTTCGDIVVDRQADNYLSRQAGLASSLTQRLSVIRGELWYAINAGLPLADKITSKGIIDAKIAEIVSKHPDVKSISEFKSTTDKHSYSCTFKVNTLYGELVLTV